MSKDRLLRKKNVIGHGDGFRRVGGKVTDEEVLIVFVEKKTSNLSEEDFIPKIFDGKKTDVVQVGKITSRLLPPCNTETMQKTIAPMRGGLMIGCQTNDYFGTLGTIVKDRITGKLFGLTNAHVTGNPLVLSNSQYDEMDTAQVSYIRGATSVNNAIYQSNPTDGNNVGSVIRDYPRSSFQPTTIDSAVFSIKSEFGVTPGIMGLTKYAQSFVLPDSVPLGTKVIKSGCISGVTTGEIISHNATMVVSQEGTGFGIEYENQIIVSSPNTTTAMLEHGDSGSMFCVDMGVGRVGIIGQGHAGTDADENGSIASASRIDSIVTLLDIVPWDGSIIASSDNDEVVSTAFGAVYVDDGVTLLNVTNDYVCDGSICGATPLIVNTAVNQVVSYSGSLRSSAITLGYTVTDNTAIGDSSVQIAATLDSVCGLRLNSNVVVGLAVGSKSTIVTAINLLSELGFSITTNSESGIVAGSLATLKSDVIASVDCSTDLSIGAVSTCVADVIFTSRVTVSTSLGVGLTALLDIDLGFGMDMNTVVSQTGSLEFGDPALVVAACDCGNCNDLSYGGIL